MSKATVQEMQAVIGAFGPCTTVYECMSPAEALEDLEESNCENLTEWASVRLDVEDVLADRDGEKVYQEWTKRRPEIESELVRVLREIDFGRFPRKFKLTVIKELELEVRHEPEQNADRPFAVYDEDGLCYNRYPTFNDAREDLDNENLRSQAWVTSCNVEPVTS